MRVIERRRLSEFFEYLVVFLFLLTSLPLICVGTIYSICEALFEALFFGSDFFDRHHVIGGRILLFADITLAHLVLLLNQLQLFLVILHDLSYRHRLRHGTGRFYPDEVHGSDLVLERSLFVWLFRLSKRMTALFVKLGHRVEDEAMSYGAIHRRPFAIAR